MSSFAPRGRASSAASVESTGDRLDTGFTAADKLKRKSTPSLAKNSVTSSDSLLQSIQETKTLNGTLVEEFRRRNTRLESAQNGARKLRRASLDSPQRTGE